MRLSFAFGVASPETIRGSSVAPSVLRGSRRLLDVPVRLRLGGSGAPAGEQKQHVTAVDRSSADAGQTWADADQVWATSATFVGICRQWADLCQTLAEFKIRQKQL